MGISRIDIENIAIKHGFEIKKKGMLLSLDENIYSFAREIYETALLQDDERFSFEEYARLNGYDLSHVFGEYANPVTKTAWMAWRNRSIIAKKPKKDKYPVLTKPCRVGGVIFRAGVAVDTLVKAAERSYEYECNEGLGKEFNCAVNAFANEIKDELLLAQKHSKNVSDIFNEVRQHWLNMFKSDLKYRTSENRCLRDPSWIRLYDLKTDCPRCSFDEYLIVKAKSKNEIKDGDLVECPQCGSSGGEIILVGQLYEVEWSDSENE